MNKHTDMRIARVYLTEGQHLLDRLLTMLHDEAKVRGVTVFRGVAGFGASGKIHENSLVDLSLDLPLVVEFFDKPARVEAALDDLMEIVKPGHVVSWDVDVLTG